MVVNVHKAKTDLSRLIALAEAGEEIVIARAGKPAVRLQLVSAVPLNKKGKRVLGGLRGKLKLPPDWNERWKAMDGEIAQLFNGPLTTGGDE